MTIRKALAASALAAIIGGGMLTAATTPASARTVCNQWGRCWQEYGYNGYYHSDYNDWRYRHRYRDYGRDRDYGRYHRHHDYDRDRYDRDRY